MPTNQGQMIVLVVLLISGMMFGVFFGWWFWGRKKANPPAQEDPWAQLRSVYLEGLSLWQDRSTGKMVTRLGGKMFASPKDASEPERKKIQAFLRDWLDWMGYPIPGSPPKETEPSTAQTTAVAVPVMVTSPAPSAAVIIPPAPPAQVPVPADPAAEVQTSISSQPVLKTSGALNPRSAPLPLVEKPATATPKPKSIVEQIDEILQELLLDSPVRNKGVRLTEDPRQGVIVWVGLEQFNGVETVRDPEVKALLRAAVAEWERRSVSG